VTSAATDMPNMKASVKIAPPIPVLKFFIFVIFPFSQREAATLCLRVDQKMDSDLQAFMSK
jgi:hypothetical protein